MSVTSPFRIPQPVLLRTFEQFRRCGCGRRECQALWISPWHAPETITDVVHPHHRARRGGFEIDGTWLNSFWLKLAQIDCGVRIQVHTHPHEAFHSRTDDEFPIIHSEGFLSLVIPNLGTGPVGFDDAYLAEIGPDGGWRQVPVRARLEIV